MTNGQRTLALAATLLAGQAAFGQFAWKHVQRWTNPWAAHESRVRGCTIPQPFNRIAVDDWICGKTGPIRRFTWWGTLSAPAQGHRPFYVAIYPSAATACQPATLTQPIYSVCLVPDVCRYVGTDCQNRRVYRLSAAVPAGVPIFTQQQGTHYWLQISEADNESIQPNVENFRWSSHRPINWCPAVQFPPFTQPIIDPCDGNNDDLAFAAGARSLSGTIVVPAGVLVPNPLQLRLFDSTGELREEMVVEPDDGGNYVVDPESPDGTYVVELSGAGIIRNRRTMTLVDGEDNRLNFFDVFYGDLNNNGSIGLDDLAIMLGNYGITLP